MKIFINPGHCIEADPGACGNGLEEAEVAMRIGQKLQTRLQNIGLTVKLFQYDGVTGIYQESNAWNADLFVSIHCNAATGTARGIETFYCEGSAEGKKFASVIQKNLMSIIGAIDSSIPDRGVKPDTASAVKRIGVLRGTDCTAILIETVFIDNPQDAKLLRDNEDDFAKAIAKGISEYLGIFPDVIDEPADPPKCTDTPSDFNADIEKIAMLARKYESNGDPACVANNPGDLGGISYGLYQFASKVGVVDAFVDWLCDYPDAAFANYGKVLAAHETNSSEFIKQWKELGTIDPGNFGKLQDEYIKNRYYDVAAKKLAEKYFNANKHNDALKAVILSRAVQNGPSGCVRLFELAAQKLGHANLSYIDDAWFDGDLIGVIYDYLIVECDLSRPDGNGIWRSPDDFCHGSKSIILALRSRFIRERSDALALLTGGAA